jgi:WD40 repeat protein
MCPDSKRIASAADLFLIVLVLLTAGGCNSKAQDPSTPKAGVPSAKDSSGSQPSKTTSSAEKSDSTGNAGATKSSTSGASAQDSASQSAVKAPVPPTPEQIAKWAILEFPPLQLLTCYDGFGDSAVQCVAASPDGKQFVLGGAKLTLWKTSDSKPTVDLLEKYKPEDVERPILSVAISPDGMILAAGDQKGTLRIWKLADQAEVVSFTAHDGRLTQLAFSPDSKTIATTSYAGEVRLWNSADGKKIKNLKVNDQEVVRLVFLSNSLLATASNEASIWNIESGKKENVLTKGYVSSSALGVSSDHHWLTFTDADSKAQRWDIPKGAAAGLALNGGTGQWIEYSQDGKLIATYSGDSNIRIWNAANGETVQVIDGDGDRTVGLKWLGNSQALLVASEQGRVRIWGTSATAKSIGVEPIGLPALATITPDAKRALPSGQLQNVIDVRSFPRLPGSIPMWGDAGGITYNTPASQSEAEQFYRYFLGKAGWTEATKVDDVQPGLTFRKSGCELKVTLTPTPAPGSTGAGGLQVSLQFPGNYDVRWLPKYEEFQSQGSWTSSSSLIYRTKAALTNVEVNLLRLFHKAGWTAYTRLNASGTEDPRTRDITMLQGGSVLQVSIGYPADSTEELFVQTSVHVSNESLPIPPDSGWIEFDSSSDLLLVANTKMDLAQTTKFFDTQMASEGWLARETGRNIKDDKAWLPYIRGQQDVTVRLATLPDGKTRIIVGNAERSSWQFQKPPKPDSKKSGPGIEAADFQIPKEATAIKFEVDQKQIRFEVAGTTPKKLADQIAKQMEALEWKRDKFGVDSDEYVLATFKKDKSEIQLRARAEAGKTTASVGGDNLLWTKPLPTAPVRISYETWLRRGRKEATLDFLDEFAAEMHKIPEQSPISK